MPTHRPALALARLLAISSMLLGPGTGGAELARDAARVGAPAVRANLTTVSLAVRTLPFFVSALFFATSDPRPAEATTTGAPLGWGKNSDGTLGQGTSSADGSAHTVYRTPRQVLGMGAVDYLERMTAVAGGNGWSLALRDDGTVWAWGDNGGGQLGNGTTTDSTTPIQVPGLTNIVAIAAGGSGNHSLALKNDGTVWAWGRNDLGQLGATTTATCSGYPCSTTPIQSGAGVLPAISSISAGGWHSLAVAADGTIWAWGWNDDGQLGNCTYSTATTGQSTPTQVRSGDPVTQSCQGFVTNAVQVAGGGTHSMARLSDGSVYVWGRNAEYEFGTGAFYGTGTRPFAVQASISGVVGIAAGWQHSLAWKSDGTAYGWGSNDRGQLGMASDPIVRRRVCRAACDFPARSPPWERTRPNSGAAPLPSTPLCASPMGPSGRSAGTATASSATTRRSTARPQSRRPA